jgi:hypothetical protein
MSKSIVKHSRSGNKVLTKKEYDNLNRILRDMEKEENRLAEEKRKSFFKETI